LCLSNKKRGNSYKRGGGHITGFKALKGVILNRVMRLVGL